MKRICAVFVALLIVGADARLAAAVADNNQADLLLVLAADVSISVDNRKFRLQREGYAAAIGDARVVRAMTGGSQRRIALCFVEWADDYEQRVIVDWMLIEGDEHARTFAQRVRTAPRAHVGRTSIGAGIDFAMKQLARSPFRAPRHIIDVSGDGTSNADRDVRKARNEAIAQGVTINGIVILSDMPMPNNPSHTHPPGGLADYYRNHVIGGPQAFVVEAQDFEAFGQALISKLIKEIAGAGGGAGKLAQVR